MSDMQKARDFMDQAVAKQNQAIELLEQAQALFKMAKSLSYRAAPVRRAPVLRMAITDDIREEVIDLAKRRKGMTMHEIARKVGLRNGGRVSEILNDKR